MCDPKTCTNGCIQVTHGLRGYFAVHMTPTPDPSGSGDLWCEPWQSGVCSYRSSAACRFGEAKAWAEAEELPLK